MPKGLNKVMLIGWLDEAPELRHTPNGRVVASFTLGVPHTRSFSEGESQEEKDWFSVVAWGSLAEMCGKHLGGQEQVYVEGRLQTRSWEDGAGRKHFRTEVVAQELIVLSDPL